MKKAEQLKKSVGGNMLESIGARPQIAGTSALKADTGPAVINVKRRDGRTRDQNAGHMKMANIQVEEQVRTEFEEQEIDQLAESLNSHGQQQPIHLRWSDEQEAWVIVSGERRYRAAKKLGWASIRVVFNEEDMTKEEILVSQLVENIHRKDLSEVDRAKAFKQLQEINNLTVEQLAARVHLAKSTISRCLSLLTLTEEQQAAVKSGKVAANTAQQITKVQDEETRAQLFDKLETEKLTRAEAKAEVDKAIGSSKPKRGKPSTKKEYKLEKCKITFTFNKKRVTAADIEAAYDELGTLLKAS